jgi:hypothetical protein
MLINLCIKLALNKVKVVVVVSVVFVIFEAKEFGKSIKYKTYP